MIVYKYSKVNWLVLDAIARKTPYFASFDQLNDPSDNNIAMPSLKSVEAHYNESLFSHPDLSKVENIYLFMKTYASAIKQINSDGRKAIRCFCSSLQRDSSILWHAYGDNHKGVMLEYEVLVEQIGIGPVEYIDSVANVVAMPILSSGTPEENSKNFIKGIMSKEKYWEPESEFRVTKKGQAHYCPDLVKLNSVAIGRLTPKPVKIFLLNVCKVLGLECIKLT